MQGASLVILVLLAVLVARGYVRSRSPGYRIALRDRALVGLTVLAVASVALGAAVAFRFHFAPGVTWLDRVARGLTVAAIGLGPVALFLVVGWVLRLVRRWENAHRARHSK